MQTAPGHGNKPPPRAVVQDMKRPIRIVSAAFAGLLLASVLVTAFSGGL